MKKLTILLILNLTTSSLFASEEWLTTPFWTAPANKNFNVKIVVPESYKSLPTACQQLKRLAFKRNGEIRSTLSSFSYNSINTSPLIESPIYQKEFYIDVILKDKLEFGVLTKEVVASSTPAHKDLPLYQYSNATSGAVITSAHSFAIETIDQDESLIEVTKKLGLDESEVEIIDNYKYTAIRVFGKDLACDLLAGKVEITAKAPGFINLAKDDYAKLENFYNFELAPLIGNVLKESGTPVLKAALLGFRLGAMLERFMQINELTTEKQMKSLIGLLFLPKELKPSSKLQFVNSNLTVLVDSQADLGDVDLTFSTLE